MHVRKLLLLWFAGLFLAAGLSAQSVDVFAGLGSVTAAAGSGGAWVGGGATFMPAANFGAQAELFGRGAPTFEPSTTLKAHFYLFDVDGVWRPLGGGRRLVPQVEAGWGRSLIHTGDVLGCMASSAPGACQALPATADFFHLGGAVQARISDHLFARFAAGGYFRNGSRALVTASIGYTFGAR